MALFTSHLMRVGHLDLGSEYSILEIDIDIIAQGRPGLRTTLATPALCSSTSAKEGAENILKSTATEPTTKDIAEITIYIGVVVRTAICTINARKAV